MHSVGCICVNCCNVFSKVRICTVNVALSLSLLSSRVAVLNSEGSEFWTGRRDAAWGFILRGRVLDAFKKRERGKKKI